MVRKGQIAGQMFIYIAAILIIGIVIFFGYRMIINMTDSYDNTISIEFQKKISDDANSLIGNYGSSIVKQYSIPKDFEELCFIKPGIGDDYTKLGDISSYPLIVDSITSGSMNNIFLIGQKEFKAFRVNNLELAYYPYFSCVKATNGIVKVTYISKGDTILINAGVYEKYCKNANASPNNELCNGLDIVFGPDYLAGCQALNYCI